MTTQQRELEGTWEEIASHAEELVGHRVRLTVLADESPISDALLPVAPPSSASSLLQYAGTWVGNDLDISLRTMYETRLPAEF